MRAAFGVSLLLGVVALVVWLIGRAMANSALDLETRFGVRGRRVVAGLVAFGMGGLSTAYGGGSEWAATIVALLAAVLAAWYAGSRSTGRDAGAAN